jgi:hypothetical protein
MEKKTVNKLYQFKASKDDGVIDAYWIISDRFRYSISVDRINGRAKDSHDMECEKGQKDCETWKSSTTYDCVQTDRKF